jgi:hypothetical protein
MLEFALALPIFLMVVMLTLQLAMLITAQVGIMWTATQTARYIATGSVNGERWRMRDSCHVPYRDQVLGAFTLLRTANVIAPVNTWVMPAYPTGPVNCTAGTPDPNERQRGGRITVTLQYNPSNLMFLPTTFFGVNVLNTLPAYTATAVLE